MMSLHTCYILPLICTPCPSDVCLWTKIMSTLSEKGQFMSSTYYLRVKLLASIHVCTCLTNESVLQEGLLLSPLPLSGAQEYCVTPTQPPNPACPSGKPCHTLNDYAKNSSDLFSGKDDVSLLFLDGLHNLSDYSLEITNKMHVSDHSRSECVNHQNRSKNQK